MDQFMEITILIPLALAAVALWRGIKIVPQNDALVVERLGKYNKTLTAGLHFIIPFVDRVAYSHSLKELALDVAGQSAITKDNVKLHIDGIVYLKITDPVKASYGIENMEFALIQLAQTTMRSEIGKISLDKTFEERESLNTAIVNAINIASDSWGVQCLRYEIKDISPPVNVLQAMELQVAAEREKRARILDSEGHKQAQINLAEAGKQEKVLNSEGDKQEQINQAEGEANAILQVAQAKSEGIKMIAAAIATKGGDAAVAQQVAEQYVEAMHQGMKDGTILMIPESANDVSTMVAKAITTFDAIKSSEAGKVLKGGKA